MCSESWGQHDTGSARRAFDTGELVMAPPGCTHVARNSTQQMRVRTTHTHLLPRALPHGRAAAVAGVLRSALRTLAHERRFCVQKCLTHSI